MGPLVLFEQLPYLVIIIYIYLQGYNLLLVVDDIEKQIVVLPEETRWVTIATVKQKYFFY